MKKKLFSLILIAVFAASMSSVVHATSESRASTHTVYFGGGLTDSIVTASSTIQPGDDEVTISCYTNATELYLFMSTDMKLYKYNGSNWVLTGRYYNSGSNTSYISDNKVVPVAPGQYKVITYHYIYNPGDEDETYTYTQSVTVN